MTCTATTGRSQGGCHAALAEIADHARGGAGDELPGRAALAVGVRRGHPQLSQRCGRGHHGGADVGVPAEDSPETVGCELDMSAFGQTGPKAGAVVPARGDDPTWKLLLERLPTIGRSYPIYL